MEACKPLNEYAWLIDRIRNYQDKMMNLDSAVDKVIDEMPESFLLKKFLEGNRAEVKMMFLTEYDEEKHIEMEREESWEEGRIEGREEGREEGRVEGILCTSKLLNYLWKNGRNEDADRAVRDINYMKELMEKYKDELLINL
jgi:predicted transposase YdaD